tara:strand:+ start:381 stop:1121 length:741 start_codon:yes stop_codon:yes gene_type:complete
MLYFTAIDDGICSSCRSDFGSEVLRGIMQDHARVIRWNATEKGIIARQRIFTSFPGFASLKDMLSGKVPQSKDLASTVMSQAKALAAGQNAIPQKAPNADRIEGDTRDSSSYSPEENQAKDAKADTRNSYEPEDNLEWLQEPRPVLLTPSYLSPARPGSAAVPTTEQPEVIAPEAEEDVGENPVPADDPPESIVAVLKQEPPVAPIKGKPSTVKTKEKKKLHDIEHRDLVIACDADHVLDWHFAFP